MENTRNKLPGNPASVPLVDLKAQYDAIKDEIWTAMSAVLSDSNFIGGKAVSEFERAFGDYCGVSNAVGVGNGTDALILALKALGVGPGDEVITVPNTFTATVEAIVLVGAHPVFVDVESIGMNLDPYLLSDAIGPNTKVIIPVHLYGQTADMSPILETAGTHGLRVLEDAAQAHGAEYMGRRAGSMGAASAFSFYPGKNLGAYGDAGAVCTNDSEIAQHVAMAGNHGRQDKYVHSAVGVNSRLDGIQAAVLSVKLSHLDEWTERRRALARIYDEALAPLEEVTTPTELPGNRHVYHLYVIRAPSRDELMEHLMARGINAGIHYPLPLHLQPAYEYLGYKPGQFLVTEQAAEEILSLPIYPEMQPDTISYIADSIAAFYRQ